ncbi:MAG: diphthamide biosynthesis enzyme Dph2 [Nitrosopumilaceae archaeon]|nr:diphthamide biosynthesis enzyme Dph2 [Nitrosopumilaceae archaeon]
MIIIDDDKIFDTIKKYKPASVALNAPEGLIHKIQITAKNIMDEFNIPAYIIMDTTWGSCDLNMNSAKILSADLLFNIGHTINTDMPYNKVMMINAFDNITFDGVIMKCINILKNKTVALSTNSQHLPQLNNVKKILRDNGINVKIGNGKGQLNDGQIFGCEFYPNTEIKNQIDANLFLGQSNFHAIGIALSTNKPTYVLDPYFNEVTEITDTAKKIQKRSILTIYKASMSNNFGIIVGLKDGQISKTMALKFKRELEKKGKSVQLFALTDITNERLKNIHGVDAFIQVACPRISMDNHFDKPVLSTPQAHALLKILSNQDIDEYLQLPHWL